MKIFSSNFFQKSWRFWRRVLKNPQCNALLPTKESAIYIRRAQLRLIVARGWLLGKKGPYCMCWTRSFLLPWAQDGGWPCLDLFFHLFDFFALGPQTFSPNHALRTLDFFTHLLPNLLRASRPCALDFQICFAQQRLGLFWTSQHWKVFVCKSGPRIHFNLFRQTFYPSFFQRLRIYQ